MRGFQWGAMDYLGFFFVDFGGGFRLGLCVCMFVVDG